MEHAIIFKELLKEKSITQKALSELSGMHQSKINRFVNGAIDLSAGEFFQLLDLMPSDFQKAYWKRKLGIVAQKGLDNAKVGDLLVLVEELPPLEKIRLMKVIASKGNLFEQQNRNNRGEEQELVRSA